MDEVCKNVPQTSETKNVLPDVVHSEQTSYVETTRVGSQSNLKTDTESKENVKDIIDKNEEVSDIETISEHIPSILEYSITGSDTNQTQSQSHESTKSYTERPKSSKTSEISIHHSLNSNKNEWDNPLAPCTISPINPCNTEPSQESWNQYDVHISEESPVVLALSSDPSSRDVPKQNSLSQKIETPNVTPRSEFLDSLNEPVVTSEGSNDATLEESLLNDDIESIERNSSNSEDIIKLDIRGQAAPKLQIKLTNIILGPPPNITNIVSSGIESIPALQNLVSPCLVNSGVSVSSISEVLDEKPISPSEELLCNKSMTPPSVSNYKLEEDYLAEKMTSRTNYTKTNIRDTSPPKSYAPDDTISFTTLPSTEYKTICEEYNLKLLHLEEVISNRNRLIEELKDSLQRKEHENECLTNEIQHLQHIVGERSGSDNDTVKGNLSDFNHYQHMLKDDSTKFYSALMSGSTSLQSSNGEKDMDREEITVNYSKLDLRNSELIDDFDVEIENKLIVILNTFENNIEVELRNKLKESLIQVISEENRKLKMEYLINIKSLETKIKQETVHEIQHLQELVSVSTAKLEQDRIGHEEQLNKLRKYYEEAVARSYSEDVKRSRSCALPPADDAGAGDARPPRSITVEFSSNPDLEKQALKYEQQLAELKTEHVAYVNELQAGHRETVVFLQEQISELKAHIQTAENTAASEYPQDIDLELEKEEQLRARDDHVRRQTLRQLEQELQVLLSDPDADLSSLPLEVVALRDKIHGDARAVQEERECSSVREESPGEADPWRQRRNNSFDQNRQLEQITKERDELRRVAVSLQHVVAQLVAYCATAEDELNHTVLAHLLAHFAPTDDTLDDSHQSSPNVTDLNVSLISRGKHVHFAPDLHSILMTLDEDGVLGFLQQQRDIGADIKQELEHSLKRLRNEAHELLELSGRLAIKKERQDSKMIEASPAKITELVEEIDNRRELCESCQLHQQNMAEAMAEGLQRENMLRAERDEANLRVAQLLADERPHSDVIEGYGLGNGEIGGIVGGSRSLEIGRSPRDQLARATRDLELLHRERDELQRERDDLQKQLEAASAQLRSTRQFIDEQAEEREAERDQHAESARELRAENARLAARLEKNARILSEVEHLENQMREMNQIIDQLETRRDNAVRELKVSKEEIIMLRDIIGDLENTLKQRSSREAEILTQLEEMRRTVDERDNRMRSLLGELESLKSEKAEQTDVTCAACDGEDGRRSEFVEEIKHEVERVAQWVSRRRQRLERAHERASPPTSDLTEDVSLPDRRPLPQSPEAESSSAAEAAAQRGGVLAGVWDALRAHARAADAALKRIDDLEMQRAALKDLAQEVRAERDVLQSRMSEQALRISSLSARLQQQRNDAEALAHAAASRLSVQLHDTHAEVQRLKEELESKDKQLARLKSTAEERGAGGEKHPTVYENLCNPKEKVVILEKELSNAQTKIAQLEDLVRGIETDKERLRATVKEHERALAEKEDQLNEIMALKLEDDQNQQSEVIEAKVSARTLSDIVSISEYDEDLHMRRADLRHQSVSFTNADEKDKSNLNRTLPPDVQRPNMSSLHADFGDQFDFKDLTPHAESLPVYLTSTQNKETYKGNDNNIIAIASADKFVNSQIDFQSIPDNCSIFPNRNISDSKNISVEPKKINFSIEPSDNKTCDEEEFPSLQELGITLDVKKETFPEIVAQLKHEIKKSKSELEICKSELKNAEEQVCEFPALKEEVEELKTLLDNTVATMENDKKFYENQLESFSSNKKLLEQRIAELTLEAGEKSKDLHLLKEDILRRENMILELAKEKRSLTNKILELEEKIEDLQNKNTELQNYEQENKQMKEKMHELQKLEQLVSEKNQQIDSLNQHLDRLDDLQRCLNDKNEEIDNIKEALEEKTNELFQLHNSVNTLTRDIAKVVEENDQLSDDNKELKTKLSKVEKEQQNALTKQQNSDSEIERLKILNVEYSLRIEELKQLNDKLKDKDTEIEILHEDINVYHNEIATLKEQLQMISRSPSPKKTVEKTPDRQASDDRRQLVRIKKQIALLQHELDFNKKDLNDKAFELAKAKLDLTELKSNMSQITKDKLEKDASNFELQQKTEDMHSEINKLKAEKQQLSEQLGVVVARLREESNIAELKEKLREKAERCQELETQLMEMREVVESRELVPAAQATPLSARTHARSPTAELERAVRDQLHYSNALDDHMMEHILSASSDEREDIPRLALNTSRSSSAHSSSSERISRLRVENERLEMQVDNLESRLRDKDALIAELNRVRDKLSSELQCAQLRCEAERDNSARLLLLLDSQKESSETLRQQDTNVIELLQRRLESAMRSEAELQQRERALQRQRRATGPGADATRAEIESEQLRSSVSVLQSKVELERRRNGELQAQLEAARTGRQRDASAHDHALAALRHELAELRRLKRESCAELARCHEQLRARGDVLTEIENHKLSPRGQKELESPEVTRVKGAVRPTSEQKEQAFRYLHGRCLLLESYRKALVWQKRYLQRSLAGYEELERKLSLPPSAQSGPLRGSKRFKSVAWCAVAALRMRYVAARRSRQRQLSAECLLRAKDRDQCQSPLTPLVREGGVPGGVRTLLREGRFVPASPASPHSTPKGDAARPPHAAHTPRHEPFLLNSPRGSVAEMAGRSKLDMVSRCLSRTLEAARDVP